MFDLAPIPHSVLCAPVVTVGVDVRCRGVVPFVPAVAAVRAGFDEGGGDCGGEMDRGIVGESAVISEVDF